LHELFLNLQASDGILHPCELGQDVKTRWNSVEFMITSFLALKVFFFK